MFSLPRISFDRWSLKRTSPFLLYVVITLLVVALYVDRHAWLERVELKIQDKMVQLGRSKGNPNRTVIIAIDNSAIKHIGEWPWDAERLGYLIGTLAEYQPRAIGLDLEMPTLGETDSVGDAFLAEMIDRAGRVVVPLDFHVSSAPRPGAEAPQYILKGSYIVPDDAGLIDYPPSQANDLRTPTEAVAKAAWSLGHVNSVPGPDGIIRSDPLIIKYDGEYYPSMSVQLARAARGIHRHQMKIHPGEQVQLGPTDIPTDDRGRMLIEYWGKPHTFPTISATQVLEGTANPDILKGKILVVGVTADEYVGTLNTSVSPKMDRTERIANAVESILRQRFITQLNLTALLELAIIVAIGVFCAIVLPRITLEFRIIILAVFLFVIVNLNYILYSAFHLVTKTLYPSLEILLFLICSPFVKMKKTAMEELDQPPLTPKPAKRKFALPSSTPAAAKSTGRKSEQPSPAFRGAAISKDELAQTQLISEDVITEVRGVSPASPAGDVAAQPPPDPPSGTSPKPAEERIGSDQPRQTASGHPTMLGRYRVIETVGQGAMGTVYRGLDPAIDRPVALKTILFRTDHGAEQEEELRERFLREARAVGKLSHPNIVTIYDVGQEGDLHYIAMEFLEGYTLEKITSSKQALNYRILAKIIMQACAALDYAHKQGIVHRDIKPANIMVLDNFEVKVADFGIAHLDQANMTLTQTGIALGTPSYISPEQLRGDKVDHRSDLFSLGVVIYELITHQKPFAAENMSGIIYNILHEEPKRPTDIDPEIPGVFEMVTLRCLAKDPYERYQAAGEIAADLVDFVTETTSRSTTI